MPVDVQRSTATSNQGSPTLLQRVDEEPVSTITLPGPCSFQGEAGMSLPLTEASLGPVKALQLLQVSITPHKETLEHKADA